MTRQCTYSRGAETGTSPRALSALAILLTALHTACTEDPATRSNATDGQRAGEQEPLLSLVVEPAAVTAGAYVQLSWEAQGAGDCEASGDWQGPRPPLGVERVGPLDRDAKFLLSCSDALDAGVAHQVSVTVSDGPPPQVRLHAGQEHVPPDGITQLNWTAEHAERCLASGGWSGELPPSGQMTVGPLARTTSFRLTCTSNSGTALGSVTVQVAPSAAVSGLAPDLQAPTLRPRREG